METFNLKIGIFSEFFLLQLSKVKQIVWTQFNS